MGSTSGSVVTLISILFACNNYKLFDMGVVLHCISTKLYLTFLVPLKGVNKISIRNMLRANEII